MDEKVINAIVRCLNSPAFRTLAIILGLIGGFWLSNLYVTHNCQKQIKKQPQNKDYFEKELENEKKQILVSWLAIFFILLAPIAINFFFSLNVLYPTASELGNVQWLGFWGSYMGGVIGAIVTGVAFFLTYKQNKEQHKETRKQMMDQQRLQILPVLAVTGVTSGGSFQLKNQCLNLSLIPSDKNLKHIPFDLFLTNISSSPALFFELKGSRGCVCEHILPSKSVKCQIGIPSIDEDREYHFDLIFNDSFGNKYSQSVTCQIEVEKQNSLKIVPHFLQPLFPQLVPADSNKIDSSTPQIPETIQ